MPADRLGMEVADSPEYADCLTNKGSLVFDRTFPHKALTTYAQYLSRMLH
jgi:hypothetical protein